MQMRKWTLAAAVAMAAIVPLSLSSVAQAATKVDVLTISKVKGTNVKAKAVLSANLASKSKLTFSSSSGVLTLSCSAATASLKVVSNPAKSGTATLSLTKSSITKCVVTGDLAPDVSKVTVSLGKTPLKVTVSDKKGDPVTVTSPIVKVVATTTVAAIGTLTCIYTAKSIKGSASNYSQDVTISKQKLTLEPAPKSSADCADAGTGGALSAKLGPVKDTSVKGGPHVFVN
jgi:hypothetical protein